MSLKALFGFLIATLFFSFCEEKSGKPKRNYNLYLLFGDKIPKSSMCSSNSTIEPMKIQINSKDILINRRKVEFSGCNPIDYLNVLKDGKIGYSNIKFSDTGGLQPSLDFGSALLHTKDRVYKNNNIFVNSDILGEASVELTFVFRKNLSNINKSQLKVHLNAELQETQTGPSFNLYPNRVSFQISSLAAETDFKCLDSNFKKYTGKCTISRESIHTVCLEVYPKYNLYMGWLNPCNIVKKDQPDFKSNIENVNFAQNAGLSFSFREVILKSFVINERGIYTGDKSKKD